MDGALQLVMQCMTPCLCSIASTGRTEEHMEARHGISTMVADEALTDPNRVVIDPDYGSVGGGSVRVVGYRWT